MKPVPVLVAGGGPAGLTFARLLALQGWPVLVVDPLVPRKRKLELVSPAVKDAFRSGGVEDLLEDPAIARTAYGIWRQWGLDPTWHKEDFMYHRGGSGYIVDRELLDKSLRVRAQEAGVVLSRGRLVGIAGRAGQFTIRVRRDDSTQVFHAGLVVDATGRPSAVGRRLGAQRHRRHEQYAYPSTRLPLPRSHSGCLNVQGEDGDWRYQMEGPDGVSETWRVTGHQKGALGGVDVSAAHLSPPAGEGWIAIGDAASSFNPIWSEGLSNAFGGAITAVGAVLMHGAITPKVREIYTMAVALGLRPH